jgi:hypothetical protein
MRILAALLALAACSDHGPPSVKRDVEHSRRLNEPPPSGGVRALPPHAIRADGVGPYRLGASLAELLDQLPSGPRVVQFNVPGVVHRDLLRAEDDAILIGGEPQGKASFVAVVRDVMARTESNVHSESNVHVGSTRDEVVRVLGNPVEVPDHARDPRIIVPSSMRNLHVVIEGDRVVAIVVTADRDAAPLAAGSADCQRPPPDPDRPHSFGACVSGNGEVVSYEGDELTITAKDGKATSTSLRGLVFAAALRAEGRDEIVAITRTDEAQARVWSLVAYRAEGIRLVRSIEPTPVYQITAGNARWIGADLHDLDLYLELTSHPDAIEVGGLLTTRAGDKIRDIIVISPVPVARHRPKIAPPEAVDAGTSEIDSANGSDQRAH